jgi:hypothetical protein
LLAACSTPHVSGLAALLRQKYPDWCPTAIKSGAPTCVRFDNEHHVIRGVDFPCVSHALFSLRSIRAYWSLAIPRHTYMKVNKARFGRHMICKTCSLAMLLSYRCILTKFLKARSCLSHACTRHVVNTKYLLNKSSARCVCVAALMTTAYQMTRTGASGQPIGNNSALDYGARHVDPHKMFNPGLVFNASFVDYARYICVARTSAFISLPSDVLSVCRQCRANAQLCDPLNLNTPSISAPLVVGIGRTIQRTGENKWQGPKQSLSDTASELHL